MFELKSTFRRLRRRAFPPSVDAFDGRMNSLDTQIAFLTKEIRESIQADVVAKTEIIDLLRKVDDKRHPNINPLWEVTKDIEAIKLNIKNFGYQIARELQSSLPSPTNTTALSHVVSSRPCRQSDIEAQWFAHWCAQLKIPLTFHRKIWEFGFLLQTLHDLGLLNSGVRALGFGCGEEPIPSFFASLGMSVVITDLPLEDAKGLGWIETGQHTSSLESACDENLVERSIFNENVALRYVDMNAIPPDLQGFDFCWSICAFEHLGSIRKGLDFIHNSLKTVKIGGWSIHTTEFNYTKEAETIDDWPTVLFRRKDFEQLVEELAALGHKVAPLDFDVGSGVLDRFIDLPPYAFGEWSKSGQAGHLKLSIDGYPSTCFGLAIQRGR